MARPTNTGSRAGTKQDSRGPQSTPSTRLGANGVGVLLYIGIINANKYRLVRNYYVSRDKKRTENKKLLVVLGCGLILLGLGYSQQATIAERLLAAALPEQLGTNQVEVLHQFGTDTHSSPSSKGNAKCLSIVTGASSSGS